MTLPRPFDHAVSPHVRKYGPAGYGWYPDFKPWLRDEFQFRCVYCLFRERWYATGHKCFSVDHLVPQSQPGGKELECEYGNLVYSCNHCNSCRRVESILNPNVHPFHDHLAVNQQDGRIEGLTDLGVETIRILHLNDHQTLARRKKSFLILALKDEFPSDSKVHELFVDEFGFPDNLPDLRTLRPPKGNPKNSEEFCFFAIRERGELPEVY